jgi:type IV secretion system protein VirB10
MSDKGQDGPGTVTGERHVSAVAGRPGSSRNAMIIGVVVVSAILVGVIFFTGNRPGLKLTAAPEMPKVVQPYQATAVGQNQAGAKNAGDIPALPTTGAAAKKPTLVTFSATSGVGGSFAPLGNVNASGANRSGPGGRDATDAGQMASLGNPTPAGGGAGPGGNGRIGSQDGREDIAERLSPTPLTSVSASLLQHQPYLLTMGTLVPCILQTAMDSTLPGMVTCVLPQDVMSKTGLTLLDRGTKIVGEFQGGVRLGVERMFVVWTRAETPQGVVITLNSPAADPLGRSGMDGEVDTQFWRRFGGAILLSVVDGLIQAGVNETSKSGTTTISTGNSQSVVNDSLNTNINIPPRVTKNQGELVSLFIVRDLDFSTVYGVQPAARPVTFGGQR